MGTLACSSDKPVYRATPGVESGLRAILSAVLAERNELPLGSRLSPERQDHYSKKAEWFMFILGHANPVTVDPTPALAIYSLICDEVADSNW